MPEKQKFLYKEINEMVDKEELLNSSLCHEIKIYSQTVYANQIPCSNVFTREIIVFKINTGRGRAMGLFPVKMSCRT